MKYFHPFLSRSNLLSVKLNANTTIHLILHLFDSRKNNFEFLSNIHYKVLEIFVPQYSFNSLSFILPYSVTLSVTMIWKQIHTASNNVAYLSTLNLTSTPPLAKHVCT